MKIKVSDLEPNPFRNIGKYPISRAKIDSLKTSIELTTFWDNILARPRPTHKGKYQIAYGHHRLVALKELKTRKVDIAVRDLDDFTMLQIMANENLDEWGARPEVLNETVLAAKKFLDGEIAKYKKWDEARVNKNINTIFGNAGNFGVAKKEGVGQTTLLKFLGGNFKQWMIQSALETFRDDKAGIIDRDAVEQFPKLEQSRVFKLAARSKVSRPPAITAEPLLLIVLGKCI